MSRELCDKHAAELLPQLGFSFDETGQRRRWLKDRKGRQMTCDDLTHYQRVVAALARTIELMNEIDQTLTSHGGWPLR